MHFFKSCLLVILFCFCSIVLVQAQCNVTISKPTTQDPVCYGTLLTANTSGTGPFTYQWQRNKVNIPQATASTFLVDKSGTYTVILRGGSCAAEVTSNPLTVNVDEVKAVFNADSKVAITPPFPDPLCGVPVKVTMHNESIGSGLEYEWEITDYNDDPIDPSISPIFHYIQDENGILTNKNSRNPVLQFNEKGHYNARLRIKGDCYDPNNYPPNPGDPDGPYVHSVRLVIVYPEVLPTFEEFCAGISPNTAVTLSGRQLAELKENSPLGEKNFQWEVLEGSSVIIDNPNIKYPQITFPGAGSYVLSVKFSNNCETSDALPGLSSPVIKVPVVINPFPENPVLTLKGDNICEGDTYVIEPTPNSPSRIYNVYLTEYGGTPLNVSGSNPSFAVSPTRTTTYYISEVVNYCESLRTPFTLRIIPEELENTIGANQTICVNRTPAELTGSEALVGNERPRYVWEKREEGKSEFTTAEGSSDQVTYSPPALSKTTTFRRAVYFKNCNSTPFYSDNEITIKVLPIITQSQNVIKTNALRVCKGTAPTLSGTAIDGNIEYEWQSSTTSATTGFTIATPADNSTHTNPLEFTPRFLTQPTWYRRMAKYTGVDCGDPVPSNVIFVGVDELPISPSIVAKDTILCEGKSTLLVASPSSNAFTYLWYTEASGGNPIGSGTVFSTPTLSQSTTFYVEAVNQNKCASTTRSSLKLTVIPISANAGRDTSLIMGESVRLSGTAGVSYSWSPSSGLNRSDVANPVATPSETTTYTLTVTNEAGCAATDQVTLTVTPRIVVVNTFSPNQDGVNETWDIPNLAAYPQASVEIFNRWGARVFQSSGYPTPWDGTHNGSPLPLATYYYVIRLNPDQKPITGSVTIIR